MTSFAGMYTWKEQKSRDTAAERNKNVEHWRNPQIFLDKKGKTNRRLHFLDSDAV